MAQYNGNITGQRWRGRDGVERAYGYLYDGANRLLQGDYVARTATSGPWAEELQRYALRRVRYDENGNILGMQRRGLTQQPTRRLPAQYGWVDKLAYSYTANSNQLRGVQDTITTNQLARATGYNGAPTSLAGDFQELASARSATSQDYSYDANGNLTLDKNKGITAIKYNYLNLPRQIQFGVGADSVVFRYTAAGQKVAKLVYQTGKPFVRTDYLGPYQYEADSLRFFPHAEGRVLRFVATDLGGTSTVSYSREFTVKDHLGNLRLAYRAGQRRTLTATLEQDPTTRQRETQLFDSLSVSPPVAQPGLARTGSYAARLNAGGSMPQPLGPLAQLGVQRGDTVIVTAPGLYPQPVQRNFWFSLGSFLANLFQPVQGAPASGEPLRGRRGLPLLQVGVAAGLTQLPQLGSGVPKGYLRLLVFGKDSSLVSQQVQQLSQAALGSYEPLRLQAVVPQDGYVTAYVGNESDVDVFFDDVTVEHRPGLQVQETQYDPAGLELAGLTPPSPGIRGLNNYRFNGKEFQADLGLNWNHQDWRFFDPQILRWHSVDPLLEAGQESWTPYSFSYDNAVRYSDPKGQFPGLGELITRAKSALVDAKRAVVGAVARQFTDRPSDVNFAKRNAVAGARAHLIGQEARAKSEAAKLPGSGDASPSNTLRHTILSAMTARALGTTMAKKVTDAHEGSAADVLQTRAQNVQELTRTGKTTMSNEGDMADSFVDQLNNAAGRQIAATHPAASDDQLQNLSLDALRGGNTGLPTLYTFSLSPDGKTATVAPASLSEEVYKRASGNMNQPPPPSGDLNGL